MAVLPEDPMVVLGYLVLERYSDRRPILHFAYVKGPFQKNGIMRMLLKYAEINLNDKIEYTHHTYELAPILDKYPGLTFNPYLL